MSNPLLSATVNMATAIGALRLKTHRLRYVAEGVEIIQPNKPVILLTFAAADSFAHQIQEAEADV